MKPVTRATVTICGMGLFLWVSYLCSQAPKWSWHLEQFGLVLTKGGYRSWTLSWCDCEVYDGHWRAVVVNKDRTGYRFGYRVWPKFVHCDVRNLKTKP